MPAALLGGLRFLGSLAARGGALLSRKAPGLVRGGGRAILNRGGNFVTGFLNSPQRSPEYDKYYHRQSSAHKILGDHPLLFALLTVAAIPLLFFYALYEIVISAAPWPTGLN